MADFKVEGPQIKKIIKYAKQKPLNFAYNPGKKTEQDYLAMDRKRKPDALMREAKKDGEGAKIAFGTAELDGKLLTLTCVRVVPTLAKKLKKYLKTGKLSLNVRVLDETGNEIESDIEELPYDAELDDPSPDDMSDEQGETSDTDDNSDTADTEDDTENAGADPAPVKARLVALRDEITGLPKPVVAKLVPAMQTAVALLKSGEVARADAAVGKIEAAVATVKAKLDAATAENEPASTIPEAPPMPADMQRQSDLRAMLARLVGQVDRLEVEDATRDKFTGALDKASAFINQSALDNAETILGKVNAAINNLVMGTTSDSKSDAADEKGWKAAKKRVGTKFDAGRKDGTLDPDDVKQLGAEWKKAVALAENKGKEKYKEALQILAEIERVIGELSAVPDEDAQDDNDDFDAAEAPPPRSRIKPGGAVAFAQSRLLWGDTRKAMAKQLESLQDAIRTVISGDAELAPIGDVLDKLMDQIDAFDEKLEDKLTEIYNAQETDRPPLKVDAIKLINDYRKVLKSDFFQDVDNNNGFVSLNVRSEADLALSDIENVLAA